MNKKKKTNSCECIPEAMPYLIFDNRDEKPFIKKRVKAQWKSLNEIKDAILSPPLDKPVKEETPEPAQKPVEADGVRQLFQKMLDMRMDQHALAIADDYRTRPQVCVCDNVCCNCFDYSNFLHNLRLHNHKELLRMVYEKMNKKEEKPPPKSETYEPTDDGEEASIQSEINDEFTMKNEQDYEGDDPNEVDLDLTVIERVKKMVCFEKPVCSEKKVSAPVRKIKRGVRVIQINEPPYETKFNSVHRRVREFDPNSYKNLVREEIKKFSEISAFERRLKAENRIKDLSLRPPWRI